MHNTYTKINKTFSAEIQILMQAIFLNNGYAQFNYFLFDI